MEPGSFIQTVSGRRVDPFAPSPEDIDAGDIAQALANQCRFGGHCRRFYSVAQHSCLLADEIERREGSPDDVLWALLHDASEAYLVDLPHPLKHRSPLGPAYRDAESALQEVVCIRFGLPRKPPALLEELDRSLLAAERKQLATIAWEWPELTGVVPLEGEIDPWAPERARLEFVGRLEGLLSRRGAGGMRST